MLNQWKTIFENPIKQINKHIDVVDFELGSTSALFLNMLKFNVRCIFLNFCRTFAFSLVRVSNLVEFSLFTVNMKMITVNTIVGFVILMSPNSVRKIKLELIVWVW